MATEKMISGARALVDALVAQGVSSIFGYPGGAIMPVYDEFVRGEEPFRHVLVRHEQGAVHAAEGYARMTGKPGVCMATSGPGATNLVTGIADAMMDSVPLVCITGQVVSDFLGTDAFQETDVIGITLPVTKWSYQVTEASEVYDAIEKAFLVASSGRPGPVVIDITKDAQIGLCKPREKLSAVSSKKLVQMPNIADLDAAVALIQQSKKPLMLVGNGVRIAEAEEEVLAFAEKAEIPVGATLHGLSAFPTRHRLYAGLLGMHGNYAPNMVTNEADLLIAVGMRFDDRVTGKVSEYGTQAKVIHIEIDAGEIDKVIPADVGLLGDAKSVLSALLPKVSFQDREAWLHRIEFFNKQEYDEVITPAITPQDTSLRMSDVIHTLSELSEGKAIVVSDVGQHQMMAARYYRFQEPNSFHTSGGLGTMGYALPAAIGVAYAKPGRPVVAVIGDGGFQMTLQELGTVVQEGLPVKILVLNNSFLGMVRQWQELFFDNRYSSVDMPSPDYVKLCDAYGIDAESIDDRADLESALMRFLEADGARFLEVKVEKEDKVFPMLVPGTAVHEMRLR